MLENWIKSLVKGGKLSLLYKENSHIFNMPLSMFLFQFREKSMGQDKISAVLPTLEEGLLHKNKQVLNYLHLGEGNAFIF